MDHKMTRKELADRLWLCGTGKCSDDCPFDITTPPESSLLSCGDKLMQAAAEALREVDADDHAGG